ncbi:MAG: hypothetical protein J4F41_00220 [Alphaproteobacteria bacterium]|nr:hypothetical protein [Alphaproteobacteria bacterium]
MAPPIIYRLGLVLARIETTEGNFLQPSSTDAVLYQNLTIEPVAGTSIDRPNERGGLETYSSSPVGTHSIVNFSVELAASGTIDTPPAFANLLRGCGMSETITANTQVRYRLADEDFESLSLELYIDGIRTRLSGARGTFTCSMDNNTNPMLNFTFTGRKTTPIDADNVITDVSDYQRPLVINYDNTTFTLDGTSPSLAALTIDLGNTVTHRDMVNREDVIITDRQCGGSVTFDMPPVSDEDYIEKSQDGDEMAFSLNHGSSNGERVEWTCSTTQLTGAAMQNGDGVLQLSGGLRFVGNSLTLTFR